MLQQWQNSKLVRYIWSKINAHWKYSTHHSTTRCRASNIDSNYETIAHVCNLLPTWYCSFIWRAKKSAPTVPFYRISF